jgi:hypothetical protein
MKVNKLPGSGEGAERKRFYAEFYNQWSGIFGRNNWYDFTLIYFGVEHSPYKGSSEVSLGLLGFTLTMTYVYDFQFTDDMESRRDEILAGMKAATGATEVHDPFDQLKKLD